MEKSLFELDRTMLKQLADCGIIKFNTLRDMDIFEFWKAECQKAGSTQAIIEASDKYCLSDKTIERIIYKMKQVCQSP
jgi:hypothetical protein